jgi:hypothetical protein
VARLSAEHAYGANFGWKRVLIAGSDVFGVVSRTAKQRGQAHAGQILVVEPRQIAGAKTARLGTEALREVRCAVEMGKNHHSPSEALEIERLATCRTG